MSQTAALIEIFLHNHELFTAVVYYNSTTNTILLPEKLTRAPNVYQSPAESSSHEIHVCCCMFNSCLEIWSRLFKEITFNLKREEKLNNSSIKYDNQ